MIDSNYYKNKHDACCDLFKNSKDSSKNFKIVTKQSIKACSSLVEDVAKCCLDILTNLEKSKEQFDSVNQSETHNDFVTKLYLERHSRVRIGTHCSPTNTANYNHYYEKGETDQWVSRGRLKFRTDNLVSLTNSLKLCTGSKSKIREFYLDEYDKTQKKIDVSKLLTVNSRLEITLYFCNKASSFWTPMHSEMPYLQPSFIPGRSIPETFFSSAIKKNIESLQYFSQEFVTPRSTSVQSVSKQPKKKTFSSESASSSNTSLQLNTDRSKRSKETSSVDPLTPPRPKRKERGRSKALPSPPPSLETFPPLPPPPPSSADIPSSSESDPFLALIPPDLDEESNGGKASPQKKISPKKILHTVKTLYDYKAKTAEELSFTAGQVISVLEEHPNGWNVGVLEGLEGFFPKNFVKKL